MTPDARPAAPRNAPIPSWLALLSALVAALAPKCPLCLAAYLSMFGVSVGAASAVLPWLRPIAVAVAVLAVVWIVVRRPSAACSKRAACLRS